MGKSRHDPKRLAMGRAAPWFRCRTSTREKFAFDTVAGRYIVLAFFGSAVESNAADLLSRVRSERERFNDTDLCFFGVSVDRADEQQRRVTHSIPGIRYVWDFDRAVSAQYGAVLDDDSYRPIVYVLDPALRVLKSFTPSDDGESFVTSLFAFLDQLPKVATPFEASVQAPVLVLPRVFEPSLCEALIAHYETHGGQESGFMRDVDGKTRLIVDRDHKRRRDCLIEDEELRRACWVRIYGRLVPEIHKAFQFRVTQMERHVISCYRADEEGHFRPHRDNTTKGTAHRRFAVSLFLNTGEYEGGQLRFPEFGSALYSAPVGGAVVFSCSLLHEATLVTRGSRFMYLPFLYDDAAGRTRQENAPFLEFDASDTAKDAG